MTTAAKYEIRYANTARGELFIWGSKESLTEANEVAHGLTFAADITRARVIREGLIATEFGSNGVLLRYRSDV